MKNTAHIHCLRCRKAVDHKVEGPVQAMRFKYKVTCVKCGHMRYLADYVGRKESSEEATAENLGRLRDSMRGKLERGTGHRHTSHMGPLVDFNELHVVIARRLQKQGGV